MEWGGSTSCLPVQVSVVSLSWSPVTTPTPTHISVTLLFFTSAHLTIWQRYSYTEIRLLVTKLVEQWMV